MGAVSSYSFTKVSADHTIYATFTKNEDTNKELSLLLTKGIGGKNYIKLTWLEEKEADGYEVYQSYCDGKKNFTKLKTTTKLTYTHKNLNIKKCYKYYVISYKKINGKKIYISQSPSIHVAMTSTKRTNVKSVRVNAASVTLAPKGTFLIDPATTILDKTKKPVSHAKEFRYYTSDRTVAAVDQTGKITARKAGKCYVYVIANNGVYKRIKVTVKK